MTAGMLLRDHFDCSARRLSARGSRDAGRTRRLLSPSKDGLPARIRDGLGHKENCVDARIRKARDEAHGRASAEHRKDFRARGDRELVHAEPDTNFYTYCKAKIPVIYRTETRYSNSFLYLY
jgi:hypothetical protein